MSRTVVVSFSDGSRHTYRNVPEEVTREQVAARVAREFSSRSVAKIERLALGAAPGDIPVAPTAAQAAAGAAVPAAPAATQPISTQPLSAGDRVVGGLEAAATVATGATTGAMSAAAGGFQELARQLLSGNFGTAEAAQAIEEAFVRGAERGTLMPTTPGGVQAVQAVGEALQGLPPVAGVTGTLTGPTALTGPALAQAGAGVATGVRRAGEVAAPAVARVSEAVQRLRGPAEEAAAGARAAGGSVGAAGVDLARLRQGLANELPVPPQLMKGQAGRGYAETQEMMVLARDPKAGEAIRERLADQRQNMIQNMDAFLDQTGAETRDLRSAAESLDSALRAEAATDMKRVRTLYKEADKRGEMSTPADLAPLAQFLNENRAERADNGIMVKVQRQLDVLEVAEGSFENGSLKLKPMTLAQTEAVRKFINRNVNDADPNDVRAAARLKEVIDASTANVEGVEFYKRARAARAAYAEKFENHELTRQLLSTKRGSADRAVALEDVVRRVVLSPSTSRDQLQQLGAIIKKSPQGQQAWRELQGATIMHLQERALSNVARDERGTPIFSAAKFDAELQALDRGGKLDYIFGKKNAEKLRTLNEVAKVIFTAPPGTVNWSNTATTLAAMIDLFTASTTGIPLPAVTGFKLIRDRIQDRKLRARVDAQLAGNK